MVRFSVIIVLYNEFELVKKTIRSVYQNQIDDIEIILVDNSTNKTGYKKVLRAFPKLKYIQNKRDLGFARAVNVGIKQAKGEFVLVLTPDMYLLPKTIKDLLSYIQSNPEVGLVGGRVYSSRGVWEPSIVSRYPGILTQLYYYNMPIYKLIKRVSKNLNPMYVSERNHKEKQFAKAISGQSMLIRKKALSQISFFDPRFFLYFEDIDLCKRLSDKGWKIAYLPTGGVVQSGMSGWKKKIKITQALPPYMKSLYLFFGKHYGNLYTIIAWLVGTTSAIMSIPYLFTVSRVKMIFNRKSQSRDLLPLWIGIVKWHFSEGLKIVLRL